MKSVLTASENYIVSNISLNYFPKVKTSERPQVNQPEQSCQLFRESWGKQTIELQEQFKIMMLNRNNRVLGIFHVSSGGIDSTVVDLRLIFSAALLCNAQKIILAHNHPSGSLRPSAADSRINKKIQDCALLFNMEIVDHLIITVEGFLSMNQQGLL